MSACQKCWSDAHYIDPNNVAEAYSKLIDERSDRPCTPEQQAGPDAKFCPKCDSWTVHEITGECMQCGAKDLAKQPIAGNPHLHLKPCPFCGDKAYVERPGTNRQSCIVACTNCGAKLESNEEGAGYHWNMRVG